MSGERHEIEAGAKALWDCRHEAIQRVPDAWKDADWMVKEDYRNDTSAVLAPIQRQRDEYKAEAERLREALTIAENRIENYRRLLEDGEDWPKDWEPCEARSDYRECVFHCTEPAGHEGPHIGGTHGMLWDGESDRPAGVVANPPRPATVQDGRP